MPRFALISAALCAVCIAAGIPSAAQAQNTRISGSMAAHYDRSGTHQSAVPSILSRSEREHFRRVFAAIDREQWEQVESSLAERKSGVLHQMAMAEYYTHANSPRVSAEQISDWFTFGVHLPQSEQLGRLGARRGLGSLPYFPQAQRFSRQPSVSKRIRPRSIVDGTMDQDTRNAILDAIRNDDPNGAKATLDGVQDGLSPPSLAEWRQRVAWSFYIENDDANALAMAQSVAKGSGPWVAEGEWVAGLAAWRLGDCSRSADAFQRAAGLSSNIELTTAAHYWAHRALIRCREPGAAQRHLTQAARYDETLYGMLAIDQLAMALPQSDEPQQLTREDWQNLSVRENVRVAVALMEIGRPALADEVLRHEARIGPARNFPALARLSRELGLPASQLFMAYNAPRGMRSDSSLRYPVAHWQPANGWQMDPALAFAHALQESNFRAGAVSSANARGLMQIRPGTASDHNRRLNLGASYSDLANPNVNLAYGQEHLQMLRDSPATQGYLPKIMAAYNAGLTPVSRWNYEIRDMGDPLLWMESIPYWETRGYVAIVMRNYWMYERAAGLPSTSRRALAQGRWPEFPRGIGSRAAQLER